MPPRARKQAAPDGPAEPEALLVDPGPGEPPTQGPAEPETKADDPQPDDEGQPCTACFPQGWPAADATSAGCGHGSWQR